MTPGENITLILGKQAELTLASRLTRWGYGEDGIMEPVTEEHYRFVAKLTKEEAVEVARYFGWML